MLKKKLLIISTMSMLVTTTVFGAGTLNCVGGACFVPLIKKVEFKDTELKVTLEDKVSSDLFDEVLQNRIDKTFEVVVDGKRFSRFPDEVYREKIEDKILQKSELRNSEYYCDNDKKAIYHNQSELYECV